MSKRISSSTGGDEGSPKWRRTLRARALLPYEDFDASPKLDTPYFRDQVDGILKNGWERWTVRLSSIRPPIPWHGNRGSFDYSLHAFEPLNYTLRAHSYWGEERYLRASRDFAWDWYCQNQAHLLGNAEQEEAAIERILAEGSRAVWYDMAVGQRIYRLAYLLDALARLEDVDEAVLARLFHALDFHHRLLAREAFFRVGTNHGVYQALGQLAAARRFSWHEGNSSYLALATQRVRQLLDRQFFQSGAHREHSPGYHYMVMGSYIGAVASGVIEAPDVAERLLCAEEALAWMIKPNGFITTFGDSDPRRIESSNKAVAHRYRSPVLRYVASGGAIGADPPVGVRAFHDAGYAFARLRGSGGNEAYLAQMAGFHSRVHKHADDLSFIWYDHGRDILIDPGRYAYTEKTAPGSDLYREGFWYADDKRIYVESTRAHNTVEIDGRSFPRNGVKPPGSYLRYAGEQSGLAVTDCSAWHFRTIRHRRRLIMAPGHFLMVLDWLYDRSGASHDYRQWFNFDSSWSLVVDGSLVRGKSNDEIPASSLSFSATSVVSAPELSSIMCGQVEPVLQGWLSDRPYSLKPTSCFNLRAQKVGPTLFATIFTFGDALCIDTHLTRFNTTMTVGQVVWKDQHGRNVLEIGEDESQNTVVRHGVA